MSLASLFYTKKLLSGNSLNIDKTQYVQSISILVASGTATITGTGKLGGAASEALTLGSGQSITLQAKDGNSPLEINITSNGEVNIIINQ
jgi:ankyrin repeat protein